MKCSICKRDLGKGYNGTIYKVNNKYICEDCADKIAKQGGFVKAFDKAFPEKALQQKEEVKQQNNEEDEKEKKKKEYEEKMKELENKYKDIL